MYDGIFVALERRFCQLGSRIAGLVFSEESVSYADLWKYGSLHFFDVKLNSGFSEDLPRGYLFLGRGDAETVCEDGDTDFWYSYAGISSVPAWLIPHWPGGRGNGK